MIGNRTSFLIARGILPFNFGMDHAAWVRLYAVPGMDRLVGSDPSTWDAETVERVNRRAKEQRELYDRLMALSDGEFVAEVERLRAEQEEGR